MRLRPTEYTGITSTPSTNQAFEFGDGGVLAGWRASAIDASSGNDISHNVAVKIRRANGNPILQDWTPLPLFGDPRSLRLIDFGDVVEDSAKWKVDLKVIAGSATASVTLAAVLEDA